MRKIALILSGGVSLGSFQAGVLSELLHALEGLNRKYLEDRDKQYRIDIITGASAGALTGVLLARAVIHGPRNFQDQLFEAWVNQVSAQKLIEANPATVLSSLLSNETTRRIAEKALAGAYDTPPASCAAETLQIAFSVSNMDGLDQRFAVTTDKRRGAEDKNYVWTTYDELRHFRLKLGSKEANSPKYWEGMASVAIASGSFPLAFPPLHLKAEAKDYEDYEFEAAGGFPGGFCYLDGGVFNNEPLSEAVRLATEIDGRKDDPDRIYILVDPFLNGSNYVNYYNTHPDTNVADTAKRLIQMIFDQSRASGMRRLEKEGRSINLRIMAAESEMTAGDQLQAFAGFLDRESRVQNYRYGRTLAFKSLGDILGEPISADTSEPAERAYLTQDDEARIREKAKSKPTKLLPIIRELNPDSKSALIESLVTRSGFVLEHVEAGLILPLMAAMVGGLNKLISPEFKEKHPLLARTALGTLRAMESLLNTLDAHYSKSSDANRFIFRDETSKKLVLEAIGHTLRRLFRA